MVQGVLLTAHLGSVHGDGEAPEAESSLRQGVGTASPGSPDLETAAAAEQRRVVKRVSVTGCKYRRKGAAKGPPGSPGAP